MATTEADSWRPGASLAALQARARLFAEIRSFFYAREVLEVDTPLLATAAATDPQISSIAVPLSGSTCFLQTSPEYAMKRLLAAYPVAIYQLGKVFREAEQGSRHNPEFTMLEWYRPGFDLGDLIVEVAELVGSQLGISEQRALPYSGLFVDRFGIDPHVAGAAELAAIAHAQLDLSFGEADRDQWLDLLFSHCIAPRLGQGRLDFVVDFPVSQAALAETAIDNTGRHVARRFELFVAGTELANGYFELRDGVEQRRRMQHDLEVRQQSGQPPRPLDERLLAALEHGLPVCSGVALGVDRLLMLQCGASNIDAVLPFSFSRC